MREDVRLANEHGRRWPTPLVIREIQFKQTKGSMKRCLEILGLFCLQSFWNLFPEFMHV